MRCPSCQNDIPENQFYCPVCRAAVYSYVPESSQKKRGLLERAGRRLLDLLIIVALVGAAVFLARQIKWNELLGVVKPAAESPTPAKTERSSGKQNQASTSSQKKTEPADTSAKTQEAAPKTDEAPVPGETKPTAKPTATPTPKPANSGQ